MNRRIFCFMALICSAAISYCQPYNKEIGRLRQFLTGNIINEISDVKYSDAQSNQLLLISINLNDSNKIKSVNILYNDSSNFINQYRKLQTLIQDKFAFNQKMPPNIII